MVTGEFLRRFRLPRLTGYLLFGVLVGPYLGNVITEPMAGQLQIVNGIATALIAFIAGLTLNFERLGSPDRRDHAGCMADDARRRDAGPVRRGLAGVGVAAGGAGRHRHRRSSRWSALFVIIVISFSPTMTAAVISETGARGRLSDLVLAIVVLADLVVLVLFSLAMQLARVALSEGADTDVNVLVRLAWEIGGALRLAVWSARCSRCTCATSRAR